MRTPRPSIWIGATSEAGIARAAKIGDAWMIGPGVELHKIRRQLDLYRGSLAELDKPLRRDYPIFREAEHVIGHAVLDRPLEQLGPARVDAERLQHALGSCNAVATVIECRRRLT